jgi:HPt (histidine-containing phosphotransfer) domain-containing protein
MNAYLSKPLSTASLVAILEALVRGGRTPPPPPVTTSATLDADAIASLRGFLKGKQFDDFVGEAQEDMRVRVERLDRCLSAEDAAGAGREAHDLVAVAGNCGASALSMLAREVERACKQRDLQTARERFAMIQATFGATLEALDMMRAG